MSAKDLAEAIINSKPWGSPSGYLAVKIRHHRAVWIYHNGPIPEGYEIHHINHNPSDNRIENLRMELAEKHQRDHWEERRNAAVKELRRCSHCGEKFISQQALASSEQRYCCRKCKDAARTYSSGVVRKTHQIIPLPFLDYPADDSQSCISLEEADLVTIV